MRGRLPGFGPTVHAIPLAQAVPASSTELTPPVASRSSRQALSGDRHLSCSSRQDQSLHSHVPELARANVQTHTAQRCRVRAGQPRLPLPADQHPAAVPARSTHTRLHHGPSAASAHPPLQRFRPTASRPLRGGARGGTTHGPRAGYTVIDRRAMARPLFPSPTGRRDVLRDPSAPPYTVTWT